jgi:hypothetical protein
LDNAKHCRDAARELPVIANTYNEVLRRPANDFDQMAAGAEDRIKQGIDPQTPGVIPKENNP